MNAIPFEGEQGRDLGCGSQLRRRYPLPGAVRSALHSPGAGCVSSSARAKAGSATPAGGAVGDGNGTEVDVLPPSSSSRLPPPPHPDCHIVQAAGPELFAEYEKLDVDCVLFSTSGTSGNTAVQAQGHAAVNSYWVSLSVPTEHSATAPAPG